MEDVKFRAWDRENKQMFNVITLDLVNQFASHFIRGRMVEDRYGEEKYNFPIKLMQYVGKKDKNDNEIYESDIFDLRYAKNQEHRYAYIDFDNTHFRMVEVMGNKHHYICPLSQYNFEKLEVIGNIYNNPELINTEIETLDTVGVAISKMK